jgi:lysine 6-dehydrogenase
MPKAIVLGAGMVGSVMAADLAADDDYEVTIADIREENLKAAVGRCKGRVATIAADLSDPQRVKQLVEPFDIVLGALASRIGLSTLGAVIEAGKDYCDISFMPEDALSLDEAARKAGVTAIVDCGVAPGLSHMMAGFGAARLEAPERIEIYVGGLPRERRWPFQYKAGFSPHDVIEEYTRPTRLIEHGRVVVRPALSEPELIDFPELGTLEAFNTDGLRSLISTLNVPFMKEKTLRYPGHIELMRVFREMGLFGQEPIEVGGSPVRPIDMFSTLVFPAWTYEEGEEDLTVMRVIVDGEQAGRPTRYTWDLLDHYDQPSRATSMSRTTAFPCAIVAKLIASGRYENPGVIPPERIGARADLFEHVLSELAARGVNCTSRVDSI